MTGKKLIKSISEYRQWAWDTWGKNESNQRVAQNLGLIPIYDCWDTNENGEDINEDGSIIPKDTAENVKVDEWVNKLSFPLIVIYWIEKDWDRSGDIQIISINFVELREFNE